MLQTVAVRGAMSTWGKQRDELDHNMGFRVRDGGKESIGEMVVVDAICGYQIFHPLQLLQIICCPIIFGRGLREKTCALKLWTAIPRF
eukprot:7849925-Pyramimonas_sp.AAC.1